MRTRLGILKLLCSMAVVAATASGQQQESGSASGQQQTRSVPLQNPGFEERGAGGSVVGWQIAAPYSVREGVGRNGGVALVYEAETPPPYFVPNQGFSVKPGRSYKASAWFKAENLRGAQGKICLEWYDAKGGWIDGSYLIEGMRGPKEDWRNIEVVAVRLPKNAVFLRVAAYAEKGATGRIFFDDVAVEEIPTHAVEGLYSDAYRNRAASGPVTFFADLNLDAADLRPEDVRAEFSLPFADGRRTVPADSLADNWASVTVNAEQLESGLAVVRLLSRDDGGERQAYDSKSLPFTKLDAEPQTGVWIDRHGRTIVDGKPFFPLGMYWGGITEKDLDLYARGPFNCLMPYDPLLTREQLDLCAARGLRALCNLKDWYSFTRWAKQGDRTRADADVQAERFIRELKDHPALLGWYHNDEIGLQHIDEMTARYRQIQALDPDHPAWSMLYQFTQTRDFLPSFDITGTDPYPDGVTEAVRWSGQSRMTERQRRDTFGKRPIWQAVQCYCNARAQKEFGRENDPASPTAIEEMRNMAWQALVAGAKGIFFYSFFDLKKDAAKYGVPFEEAFAEVCEVAEEIKRHEDVLLATESVAVEADSPWIGVRTWKRDGDVYLAIVNKRHEPTTGRVTVKEPDGVLNVNLPPCGVVFGRLESRDGGLAVVRMLSGDDVESAAERQENDIKKRQQGDDSKEQSDVEISNGMVSATVSPLGAQLRSLRMGGVEYMWQKEPGRPSGIAPVLFPICGSLNGGHYVFGGCEYGMKGHGFASTSHFRAERSPNGVAATFTLESDETTRAQYPFDFSLAIEFRLEGAAISVEATVRNTGAVTMPFAYGGHPGFNVPLGDGGDFGDWFLEFAQGAVPEAYEFGGHGLVTGGVRAFPLAPGNRIPLRHALFNGPGLFLRNAGREVSLRSEKSPRSVTVRFPDMANIGFWHEPGEKARWLCIEPWSGLPSTDGVPDDFATRPNMTHLAPDEAVTLRYSIELH